MTELVIENHAGDTTGNCVRPVTFKRVCSVCGEIKLSSDFPLSGKKESRYACVCADCLPEEKNRSSMNHIPAKPEKKSAEETRKCRICGEVKPDDEFTKTASNKWVNVCSDCLKESSERAAEKKKASSKGCKDKAEEAKSENIGAHITAEFHDIYDVASNESAARFDAKASVDQEYGEDCSLSSGDGQDHDSHDGNMLYSSAGLGGIVSEQYAASELASTMERILGTNGVSYSLGGSDGRSERDIKFIENSVVLFCKMYGIL